MGTTGRSTGPSRYKYALAVAITLLDISRCTASICYDFFRRSDYPYCIQANSHVSVAWSVQAGSITFALDVDGEWSWVGVGLSEGGMYGADIALASHDDARSLWLAGDYSAVANGFPQLDMQQDASLVMVERTHGRTLVALRRPLVSCEAPADRPVLNGTRQTVIFAYGDTPSLAYHGPAHRGQFEAVLVPDATQQQQQAANPSSIPADAKTVELRMPLGPVPTVPTTYQCVNLEVPADTKYHIYRYGPLIANQRHVHHMLMFHCPTGGPPKTPLGVPYECGGYMECEEWLAGWAPGVEAVDAPAEAALPLGGGKRYVALQIHYTNVEGEAGQTDNSGFYLTYSPTLKKYDMGTLTLGSFEIAVPPGAPAWSTPANVCPGACTAQLPGPVTLVDSFYHMHQLGTAMVTRHVRNGAEVQPPGRRDYFNFDYQGPSNVPPTARQLLPGDALVTSCTYSGVGRTNVTYEGLASYEEMCFNFLTYYPYNGSITQCWSMPGTAAGSPFPRSPLSGYATCADSPTTWALFDTVMEAAAAGDNATAQAAIRQAIAAGTLVAAPAKLDFKPYAPACTRTAASQYLPAPKTTDMDDEPPHGSPSKKSAIGGAIAAILIVILVGAVVGVVLYKRFQVQKQAEEEQHLFEKYNPNAGTAPVAAAGSGSGGGPTAASAAV